MLRLFDNELIAAASIKTIDVLYMYDVLFIMSILMGLEHRFLSRKLLVLKYKLDMSLSKKCHV